MHLRPPLYLVDLNFYIEIFTPFEALYHFSADVMKHPLPQGDMSTGLPYPREQDPGGQGIGFTYGDPNTIAGKPVKLISILQMRSTHSFIQNLDPP